MVKKVHIQRTVSFFFFFFFFFFFLASVLSDLLPYGSYFGSALCLGNQKWFSFMKILKM